MGFSSLESPKNAAIAKELGFKVPPKAPNLAPNLKPVNPLQPAPNYGGSSGSGLAEVALAGAKAVGLKLALDKKAGSDPLTPEGSGGGAPQTGGIDPSTATPGKWYQISYVASWVNHWGYDCAVATGAFAANALAPFSLSWFKEPGGNTNNIHCWECSNPTQALVIPSANGNVGLFWGRADHPEYKIVAFTDVVPIDGGNPVTTKPGGFQNPSNTKPSPNLTAIVIPSPSSNASPDIGATPTPLTPEKDANDSNTPENNPNPEDNAFPNPNPETSPTPINPQTGQPTSELGTPAQLEEAPSPVTPGALEKAPPVPEVPTSDLVPPVTTTKPPCQPANSCESSMISTMQEIKDTLEDLLDLIPDPVDCSPDAAIVATDACTEGELLEGTTIVDVPKGTASGWLWVSDRLKHITKLICEMPEPTLGISEHFHLKPGTGRSSLLINYKEHDGWTWQRSTFTITVPHPSSSTVSSFETLQPPARSIGGHYVTLTLLDGSRLRATGDSIENAKAFMTYLVSLIDTQWIPPNWDLNLTESFSNKIATREVFPRKLEYFPEGQTSSNAPKYERFLPKI